MQSSEALSLLRLFISDVVDFIYPPYCALCQRELDERNRLICEDCFQAIRFIDFSFCNHCGRSLSGRSRCRYCRDRRHSLVRVRSLGVYRGTLPRIIHLLKYEGKPSLSGRLGTMMASVLVRDPLLRTADLIVPVPLHPIRKRQRGYNQSALIARALSESAGLPLADGLLLRRRKTRPQTDLRGDQREQNVSQAFAVREGVSLRDRTVLLVDDVMTTGATLHSCGLALLEAGAREVYGMTCASTT